MKKCDESCYPACDFCRFYNFNANRGGVYCGDGYCVLHEKSREPGHQCNDFICFEYKVRRGHNANEIRVRKGGAIR